jgi:hypothetical protein
MKWVFLSLLVLVGGALAAFALFTFAWQEGGEGDASEAERGRALAYAEQLAEHTSTIEGDCSLVGELERIAPRTWRARIRCASGASPCYAINVDEFEFEGAPRTRCPGD